jgi:hypothetical protein
MYPLFLIVSVALVTLSPLALELWLTWLENRTARRRAQEILQTQHPDLAWAFPRLR